jgi:hypothetical protein
MYMRADQCDATVRFGWTAMIQCLASASASDASNAPFHIYRSQGQSGILRFNAVMHDYGTDGRWRYFCTLKYNEGSKDAWLQDIRDYSSVSEAKQVPDCIWTIDALP